jgi:hypothetical protein
VRSSFVLAGAVVVVASLVVSEAHANGRFPMAQYFLAGHGAASSTLVLKTTFGLAVSDDGGATFHYLCEDALGYGMSVFDPAVALLPDRTILIGLSNGATHVAPDRCTFTPIASLSGQYIDDFDVDPSGAIVLAAASTGFIDDVNHLWRSEDGGATFVAMGAGKKGTFFTSVEIARTDTSRIWSSALQLSPRKVIVFRSDDGGATLIDTSFPLDTSDFAVVSGIDPANRDLVYVRAEVTETSPVCAPATSCRRTHLYRSSDAGATWHDVVESKGEMLGFALADPPIAKHPREPPPPLFMGGPKDGLQRSDDDGATWTHLSDVQVQCLRWSGGVLYVCGSEREDADAGYVSDRFAVADSCDRGTTLHPLLGFLEIAGVVPTCSASSPEQSSCPTRWDGDAGVKWTFPKDDLPLEPLCAFRPDAGSDADAAGDAVVDSASDAPDDVSSDADAGAIDPSVEASNDAAGEPPSNETDSSGGCGCGVVGAASNATWIAVAVVSTFAALRARRSRRSRRTRRRS